MAYEYSGTQLIKTTVTSSSGGSPDFATHQWENGNAVSVTNLRSGNMTVYEFDESKPYQHGDYFQVQQLLQGYETLRPKNIVRKIEYSANVNYIFSTEGQISGYAINDTTFNYQYQCS